MPIADVMWLGLVASIFCAALVSIVNSYRIAAVSIVAPFEYSYLLWVAIAGYVLLGTVPASRTIIGSLVIVVCGCYVVYRERKGQNTKEG